MENGFKKILLVSDGSPNAKSAEETALNIAGRDGSEVIIADTIRRQGRVEKWFVKNAEQMYESLEKEKQEYLDQIAARFSAGGVKNLSTTLLHGKSSEELTREVIRSNCDLLIRYRKGPDSPNRGPLGTTAMNLLRVCPCPVLLVKENQTIEKPNVLACVDIHDHDRVNDEILTAAKRLAGKEGPPAGILYCWDLYGHEMIRRRMSPDSYEQLLNDLRIDHEKEFDEFLAKHEMNRSMPNVAIIFGQPDYAIVPFATENAIDVTVMSTIAPNRLVSRLLGSTIENVIAELPTNLLAVKPQGFISPVKVNGQQEAGDSTVQYSLPYVL